MTATLKVLGWWRRERSQAEIRIYLLGFSVLATILSAPWGNTIAASVGGFVSSALFAVLSRKPRIVGLIANLLIISVISWLRSDLTPFCWMVGFFFICILHMAGAEKE